MDKKGYEIVKFIGQGSFGKTFLVKKDDHKYIMKTISLQKTDLEDVLLEVQSLKKITKYNKCKDIHHNNSFLCLIDNFSDYDTQEYIIIMNYLDNAIVLSTLLYNYKILNKRMQFNDIIFIMTRLISQLFDLHSYGIIHNDIKPDNIIVQYIDNEIKNVLFIDFGLSCIKVCRPSGTIMYLAPELFRIINNTPENIVVLKKQLLSNESTKEEGETIPLNKHDYMKTDVYSLGIVFYEILHNKMPYPYKNDYIREQTKFYVDHPLDFELDLLKLKNENINLYNYIENLKINDDEDEEPCNDESNESQELRQYKIDTYIKEYNNKQVLLSPEYVLGYYNYYKLKPIFKSVYIENESGTPQIALMINDMVEQMLIINPLKRPSIHRIRSKFNKIIIKL